MTTPRDDIAALSQRLRFDAARCELHFSKGVASNIEEAADAIDALQARVKELEEHKVELYQRAINSEARATRLQQERDEAYERLKPFAKVGELFQPREPGDYDQCIYAPAAGSEYNLSGDHLRAARDLVRRLAGPEKIAAANDGKDYSPRQEKI